MDAAGLKVKLAKPGKDEKMLVLHIEGDETKIDGYEIVADGKSVKPASVKLLKGAEADAAKDRYLQFADKVPAEFTLRIVVLKGLKSRTIPFEFAKLELP